MSDRNVRRLGDDWAVGAGPLALSRGGLGGGTIAPGPEKAKAGGFSRLRRSGLQWAAVDCGGMRRVAVGFGGPCGGLAAGGLWRATRVSSAVRE